MTYRIWLVVIPLILSLSSCGKFMEKFGRLKESGTTQVTFNQGQNRFFTALNGGMMVYIVGQNVAHRQAIYVSSTGTTNSAVTLANGNYEMYALGFATAGMQGSVHCGAPNNNGSTLVQLSGGSQSVSFSLAKANCSSLAWDPDTTDTGVSGFKALNFVSCSNTAVLSGKTPAATCTSTPEKGSAHSLRSVRMSFVTYQTNGGAPSAASSTAAMSACVPGTTTQTFASGHTLASSGGEAVFALSDSRIFYSVNGGYSYISTDGGANFTSIGALPNSTYFTTKFAGSGTNMMAIASGGGTPVYYSTDSGDTWTASTTPGASIYNGIAGNGSVFLATESSSTLVHKSTDGGDNFDAGTVVGSISSVASITRDSVTGYYVVGGLTSSTGSVYVSTNSGASWSGGNISGSSGTIAAIAAYNGVYYAGTGGQGIYISTNGGNTWTQYCSSSCANSGLLPNNQVNDIQVKDGLLYISTESGLVVSSNLTTLSASTSVTYGATPLGGTNYDHVKAAAVANGHIWTTTNYSISNPLRKSDEKGDGAPFAPSLDIYVPALNTLGGVLPWAMKLETFDNPTCSSSAVNTYFLPGGLTGPENSAVVTLKYLSGYPNTLFFQDL